MAIKYFDGIEDTTTTTGTGAITVSGTAPALCQTFSARLSVNDTFYYRIEGTTEWESGIGTYSAANQITRTTVLASSNADAAVNFSAGTKTVKLVVDAEYFRTNPVGDVQEFTASGTWTKPAGANFVRVLCIGAGGGGGSGRRGAASSNRSGGAGGAGGSLTITTYKASDLPSSVTVTLGAGGTGGAATTADSTDGNVGNAGGNTLFDYTAGVKTTALDYKASGGSGGAGGVNATGTGAVVSNYSYIEYIASSVITSAGAGRVASGTAADASNITILASTGGGGGVGISSANAVAATGGTGGTVGGVAGGVGGTGGGVGGNGNTDSTLTLDIPIGTGGGGGTGHATNAGGAGGNGAGKGAGGGGGAGSTNGANSGAGGNGSDGYCVVWSW